MLPRYKPGSPEFTRLRNSVISETKKFEADFPNKKSMMLFLFGSSDPEVLEVHAEVEPLVNFKPPGNRLEAASDGSLGFFYYLGELHEIKTLEQLKFARRKVQEASDAEKARKMAKGETSGTQPSKP